MTDTAGAISSDVFNLVIDSNTIAGAAGNDTVAGTVNNDNLFGLEGNDVLNGMAGNDLLDGGIGIDSMSGGLCNDTYVVDERRDVIIENSDEGTDTLQSNISQTLGANVENLTLTGSAKIKGAGNELDNVIIGNSANNKLDGGDGNDTLIGGDGRDMITGGSGADIIDLTETTQAVDHVKIKGGDSLVTGIDKIYNFNVAASLNDQLDIGSTSIAADEAAADGINYNTIKSHAISDGMISFDGLDAYSSPLVIDAANIADVNDYLATNLVSGKSVALYVDADSNGVYTDVDDYLHVFQGGATAAGTISSDDTFVDIYTTSSLVDVTALGTSAAANTLQII